MGYLENEFLKLFSVSTQYFTTTCRSILDDFFDRNTFVLYKSDITSIVYNKSDIYFHIGYSPECGPNYSLQTGIGFIENINDESVLIGVGLWYALPDNFDYSGWKFSNQKELEEILPQVGNDIARYAKPLWDDPNQLRELINKWSIEDNARRKGEFLRFNQNRARKAYKKGQFNIAINIYEEMGIENLTAVDLKMYDISKRKR